MRNRTWRTLRTGVLALLVTVAAATARGDDEFRLFPKVERRGEKVQLFPDDDRLLKPLLADPEEAQTRVSYGFPSHGEHVMDATFGGNVVILRWEIEREHILDLSVRGRAGGRFEATTESFPLLAADFMGGAAFAWQYEEDTVELLASIESSHLGDEAPEPLDQEEAAEAEAERFDYDRRAVRLLWSHDTDEWRLYAGGSFLFDSDPEPINQSVVIHGGLEYYFVLGDQDFYAALDVQVFEYDDWNTNVTAQVGWFLGPVYHQARPRLFLEAFTGHSPFGQFWDESETFFSVGLAIGF
ncbi:MAG: DUF1207 domain-containing protein [Planctomycetes bacterium]|nr:DUF1207 domain-containing protein [Planctomycetota bacterium]